MDYKEFKGCDLYLVRLMMLAVTMCHCYILQWSRVWITKSSRGVINA